MKQKRELSVIRGANTYEKSFLDPAQEISRLKKEILELALKNQQLEKALNSQDTSLENSKNFLNNISHEVRTPIQGINAIAKGLVSNWNNFDNETNFELASKIAQNSQRLFSIIDNILELSNFKNGKIDLKFRKVNITNFLNEMIEECISFYLQDKDLTIEVVSTIDANAYILCDEDKITQVLRNLLSNAIKITPQGKITIEAKENKGLVVISVIDSGPGIEENNDIFSEDNSKNDHVGIGLIVSNAIIKAHGGKIWAENNSTKGAKFSFTLPLPNISPSPNSTTALQAIKSDTTTKANIMVIDDEETCLLSLTMMLHKTHYTLYKFSSPIKALECLYTTPVPMDIILLDMMMPELNGLEVMMKLKSNEKLKNIPVIMQSGIDDIEQINAALSMGVKDFIRKPYSREVLITAIENIAKSNSKN